MTRLRGIAIVVAAVAVLLVPSFASAQGDPAPRGGAGANLGGGSGNPGGGQAVSSGNTGGGQPSSGSWGGGSSSGGGDFGGAWGSNPGSGAIRRPNSIRSGDQGVGRRYNNAGGAGAEIPWYSRSRGDRPMTGTPAGREGGSGRPVPPGWTGGGNWNWWSWGYLDSPLYYPWYQFYGDCGPMYGFGGFGMGYFYYDPGWWSYAPGRTGCNPYGYSGLGAAFGGGYDYPYGGGAYGRGGGSSRVSTESRLKLKVKPSSAHVFVDGYFAGEVDEFDGLFQSMPVSAGQHRVEVRAPGYAPLLFEVRVEPFQKVTYKGELQPVK